MMFTTPALLYALPAMAIPVILYLISRRKRRDVPWGATYVLRLVMETNSRVSAWLQYLIIALRTLAIAALILAFAGPQGAWQSPPATAFPAAPRATHRVVLLDTSTSMQARTDKGTGLDAALSLSRRIMASARAPGQVDLLPLDGREASFSFHKLPVDNTALEAAVAECLPSDQPLQLRRGLQRAVTLFRASPWQARELYVLSDFAAVDFQDELPEISRLLQVLREMDVNIYPIRFTPSEPYNFAVLDMAPAVELLLANQPSLFRINVGAYPVREGAGSAQTVLTITDTDNQTIARETITLERGEREIAVPIKLPPGRHTLTARLTGDALSVDNELQRSYRVQANLNAVIIQNIIDKTGFDNPRTWLETALANSHKNTAGSKTKFTSAAEPYAAHSNTVAAEKQTAKADAARAPFTITFEGKIPEQISADGFQSADMVILLDLDRMPEEAITGLHAYVLRGGTVVLAPGPTARPEKFNATFRNLTPSPIREPRHEGVKPQTYEQCLVEAGDAVFWRELESPKHGNLAAARFYNYYRLAETEETTARTLLELSDGSPLLQVRGLGRGRVLLWTAGLGGDWHSLVVHPGYPVLLTRLLQQSAERQAFPINLAPGHPILLPAEQTKAKVVRPDGNAEIIDVRRVGDRPVLRYEKTDLPGTYDVRFDIQSELPGLLFHVRPDRHESDLRPIATGTRTRLEQAVAGDLHETEKTLVNRLGERYGGPSYAIVCVLLAIVCFLAEAGLTRKVFL